MEFEVFRQPRTKKETNKMASTSSSSSAVKVSKDHEETLSGGHVHQDPYRHKFQIQMTEYCRQVLIFKLKTLQQTTSLVADLMQTLSSIEEKDLDLESFNPIKYDDFDEAVSRTKGARINRLFFSHIVNLSRILPLDNLIAEINYAFGVLDTTFVGVVDFTKGVTNHKHIKCALFLDWIQTSITFELDCKIDMNDCLAANLTDILLEFNFFLLWQFGKASWKYIRSIQLKLKQEEEQADKEKTNDKDIISAEDEEMDKISYPVQDNEENSNLNSNEKI